MDDPNSDFDLNSLVEGVVDDGQHAEQGQGQHHHGGGQGGHGGEGEEQLHRVLARRGRKVRGISRDGRPQLSIVNFICKSVRGVKSSTGQEK